MKLGYVSEANSDPCFPYPEIAQQIAERAGLHGRASRATCAALCRRSTSVSRSEFLAEAAGEVPEAEIDALNKSHRSWVMRLISLLVGLVVARHRARHRLPAEQWPAAGADQHHQVDHGGKHGDYDARSTTPAPKKK